MMTPSSSPPPPSHESAPPRDGFVGVHIGAGQARVTFWILSLSLANAYAYSFLTIPRGLLNDCLLLISSYAFFERLVVETLSIIRSTRRPARRHTCQYVPRLARGPCRCWSTGALRLKLLRRPQSSSKTPERRMRATVRTWWVCGKHEIVRIHIKYPDSWPVRVWDCWDGRGHYGRHELTLWRRRCRSWYQEPNHGRPAHGWRTAKGIAPLRYGRQTCRSWNFITLCNVLSSRLSHRTSAPRILGGWRSSGVGNPPWYTWRKAGMHIQ